MSRRLLELTGAGFPLFAFSHCRDVVAVVSKAGGFGVAGVTPEEVETELAWIDRFPITPATTPAARRRTSSKPATR